MTDNRALRQGGQIIICTDPNLAPVGNSIYLIFTEAIQLPNQTWQHRCGTTILAFTVYHPIHDGPFALSGSGRVHTEQVPYCPTCEREPNWAGAPITPRNAS